MAAIAKAERRISAIIERLKKEYPDAECALVHDSPLQLTVATILSAQCTDARVNIVTKDLFRKYRSAADFARAPIGDLERAVQSTGFFRNKAKNIKACCEQLVRDHAGKIPQDLETLVNLPGIGRKTANVVLGTAFGLATGVVVDTHVTRLSQRLGLTRHTNAVKIETDLMDLLPKSEWIEFSHRLIHHGRKICVARKPRCEQCVLLSLCPQVGVKVTKKTANSRQPKQVVSPGSSRSSVIHRKSRSLP